MEKSIFGSLDIYHKELRNYQYEMEIAIKTLTQEINNTMIESIEMQQSGVIKDILLVHKNKKIYSVVSHISDVLDKKKCTIVPISDTKYNVSNSSIVNIGTMEIQAKKLIFQLTNNMIELIFTVENTMCNNTNYTLLEQYL